MGMDKQEMERAGIRIVSAEEMLVKDWEAGEVEREVEKISLGDTVHYVEEREVTTAAVFYIIPSCKIAIPQCSGAHELLCEVLVSNTDFEGSGDLADYPLVSEYHLHKVFSDYKVLPRRCMVKVTKPTWLATIRERDRAKRLMALTRVRRMQAVTDKAYVMDISI